MGQLNDLCGLSPLQCVDLESVYSDIPRMSSDKILTQRVRVKMLLFEHGARGSVSESSMIGVISTDEDSDVEMELQYTETRFWKTVYHKI
jgi:hypothetical protein